MNTRQVREIRRVAGLLAVAVGTCITAGLSSANAAADPGTDPCANSTFLFCRMMPISPELDHDIDLTTATADTTAATAPTGLAPRNDIRADQGQ